ncbi:MAG: gamma-glutamyl-gamma-aminobutyrate hydrolase family protein [Bacteroidetes bacterium]|jgi:putative glutamine amidotransferase|nr:gamma-glutamyl-gamma-aminobutyrate hydrolase family protein [Bacteroidota bacterium]
MPTCAPIRPFVLLVFMLMSSLTLSAQQAPLNIAISWERLPQSHQYGRWLQQAGQQIRIVVLYELGLDRLAATLDSCDALLLTGGHDIYPAWYGQEADTARCGTFNLYRDSLEMHALDLALERHIPVMGICRGMQLINVHQGGTLYIDLPEDTGSGSLHREGEEGWTQHLIYPGMPLLAQEDFSRKAQLVASNHHQGINKLAEPLLVMARTADSLTEAISWKNPEQGFLLAVQWHPEWTPLADEMAVPLASAFLKAAATYQQRR